MYQENESYDPVSPTGQTLLKAADVGAARDALALGSLATQNADNVNITGGAVSGAAVSAVEPTDEVTSNTALNQGHKVVVARAVDHDVALTLPQNPAEGQPYDIKAVTAGAYVVTVQKHAESSHTIDGADSITVPNGSSRSLVYVGNGNWILR